MLRWLQRSNGVPSEEDWLVVIGPWPISFGPCCLFWELVGWCLQFFLRCLPGGSLRLRAVLVSGGRSRGFCFFFSGQGVVRAAPFHSLQFGPMVPCCLLVSSNMFAPSSVCGVFFCEYDHSLIRAFGVVRFPSALESPFIGPPRVLRHALLPRCCLSCTDDARGISAGPVRVRHLS